MSLSLKFKSIKEEKPENGSTIYYFEISEDIYGQSFEFKSSEVGYIWDNGEGTSWSYTEVDVPEEGDKLLILLDTGYELSENQYWLYDHEFYKQVDQRK